MEEWQWRQALGVRKRREMGDEMTPDLLVEDRICKWPERTEGFYLSLKWVMSRRVGQEKERCARAGFVFSFTH
jgi:hypothetical protein